MSDEMAVAVQDAPEVQDAAAIESPDLAAEESTEPAEKQTPEDKTDLRRQPDALKKFLAEQRRQAEAIQDPAQRKFALENLKRIFDGTAKNSAYESVYPTVREAREVKALIESYGGRDGLTNIRASLEQQEQIDQQLAAGDPRVLDTLFQQAGDGVVKLAPALLDRLAKDKPEAYAKAVAPHAIRHLDSSGFPQAFDAMVEAFMGGKTQEGQQLAAKLAQWVQTQRQNQQQQKTDPEVERLRNELAERDRKSAESQVNSIYDAVNDHGSNLAIKEAGRLGAAVKLSQEQIQDLAADIWDKYQTTRNADGTYKQVVGLKYKQNPESARDYMNQHATENLARVAEQRFKLRYGHLVKAGVAKPNPTAQPGVPTGPVKGQQPTAAEIDYGPTGMMAARKAGFKDVGEMILNGQAPLKAGGIRKWR